MIVLQEENFDIEGSLESMRRDDCGANLLFLGTVKSPIEGGEVTCLELESYKEMAQSELEAIEREARKRYDIADVLVIHRYGRLSVGSPIVLLIIVSVERTQAYGASRYILEELKGRVPIFKKEHMRDKQYWHGE